MRVGTLRSVCLMRPSISAYSASWKAFVGAMIDSVYAFSASRYLMTSALLFSRSQK